MPWVKLDDAFFSNRKVRAVSVQASHLAIAGLCFCAQSENDGHLLDDDVRLIANMAKVGPVSKLLEELVKVGIWEREKGGFAVHDFLEYNPSHAELEQKRSATKKRVAAYRKREGNGVGNTVTTPVSNGVGSAVGNMTPLPVPSGSPLPFSASGSGARVATGGPMLPDTAHNLVWAIKAAVESAQPENGMWAPDTFAQENASRLLVGLGDVAKAMPELQRKIGQFAADPEMRPWTVKKFCDAFNGIGKPKAAAPGKAKRVSWPAL